MKQFQMHRRTMLRGAGGVLIGLPLLEEMILPAAAATEPQVPVRAFNVFFGSGNSSPASNRGF